MKYVSLVILLFMLASCNKVTSLEHFNHVDQVIWVVSDLEKVIESWNGLGFNQIKDLGIVEAHAKPNEQFPIRMAVGNLAGANITWIQPLDGNSIFKEFLDDYGNGIMSLVHNVNSSKQLQNETKRLSKLQINFLSEISLSVHNEMLNYTFMDTREKGKYVLGYINNENSVNIHDGLSDDNRHNLKLNQYAFAINNAEDISKYWAKIGFPEFQINNPVLSDTKYQGEIVDHKLIQGWQRHGDIAYEWCIPVKGPIVYTDHINLHGEGVHHLAFSADDIDAVLKDYTAMGYKNTMGGAWGERGKQGSGRYEYFGLEEAGGVTIELLWNFVEN